jgi:hypothetical protein
VAVSYLGKHGEEHVRSQEHVGDIMRKSHVLLEAVGARMMMLSELLSIIPVPYEEIAGMTTALAHPVPMTEESGLLVCSLVALLRHCQHVAKRRSAVVVTLREHTVCFLMDGAGNVELFDPLPASLRAVTADDNYSLPPATEYSGLLLYKRARRISR